MISMNPILYRKHISMTQITYSTTNTNSKVLFAQQTLNNHTRLVKCHVCFSTVGRAAAVHKLVFWKSFLIDIPLTVCLFEMFNELLSDKCISSKNHNEVLFGMFYIIL